MNQKKTSIPMPVADQNPRKTRLTGASRFQTGWIRRHGRDGRAGFGTLEVVIIIAVLLSIALIFRASLTRYAESMIQAVLGDQSVIDDLANDNTNTN